VRISSGRSRRALPSCRSWGPAALNLNLDEPTKMVVHLKEDLWPILPEDGLCIQRVTDGDSSGKWYAHFIRRAEERVSSVA
jgi:hypothetical protein